MHFEPSVVLNYSIAIFVGMTLHTLFWKIVSRG